MDHPVTPLSASLHPTSRPDPTQTDTDDSSDPDRVRRESDCADRPLAKAYAAAQPALLRCSEKVSATAGSPATIRPCRRPQLIDDLLHECGGTSWKLKVSSYKKLRLAPLHVARIFGQTGLDEKLDKHACGMVCLLTYA
jgi:hypothetical protein